jgi:hypothetical protein
MSLAVLEVVDKFNIGKSKAKLLMKKQILKTTLKMRT